MVLPWLERESDSANEGDQVPMNVIQSIPELNDDEEEPYDLEADDPMLPRESLTSGVFPKGRITVWKVICLTLCLSGLQFTWSVEMAYGTPYLLSLGLSKAHMSLVWIAGPLSGLLMQPVVGAFSDRCTSRWGRRRPFMAGGSIVVVLSLLLIGWTRDITALMTGTHEGESFKHVSIVVAVAAIYILDFGINCVQASCRALIVDSLPPYQQEDGTAWAGRMVGVGNVVGYFMGYVDLVKTFPWLGNTQLKVLCLFASLILLVCEAITCCSVKEKIITNDPSRHSKESPLKTLGAIAGNIWNLPRQIQCICNVQFFAWIGWFPFLFYATTWVAEIYDETALKHPNNKTDDALGQATRAGSFAFLIYSIVSLAASILLPLVIVSSYSKTENEPALQLTILGRHMSFSPARYLKISSLTLPRAWTASHLIFCVSMLATILVSDVAAASILIGICGVSWAITIWAPFSLLGEYISKTEEASITDEVHHLLNTRSHHTTSKVNLAAGGASMGIEGGVYQLVEHFESEDGQGDLLGTSSRAREDEQSTTNDRCTPDRVTPSAGVLLGIHNMYIVLPQFLVTFFCSIIFHFLENSARTEALEGGTSTDSKTPPNAIGFVLRCGAVMAGIAGYLSTKVYV